MTEDRTTFATEPWTADPKDGGTDPAPGKEVGRGEKPKEKGEE